MTDPVALSFSDFFDRSEEERLALLGGKGKSLADMTSRLELPVPPGFTLTTNACAQYKESGWSSDLDRAVDKHLAGVEQALGRKFGDPNNPLLLSVRSGAASSMPGMMDTILNVGLSPGTIEGFAQSYGNRDFAEDCFERLKRSYLRTVGRELPADPKLQLRRAIEAVFQSWNSDRARTYRKIEDIDDDAGTAVNIQAMVFGNLDSSSGTGVVFSRDPSTGEPTIFGDVLFEAQGEDVVSGTALTQSIHSLESTHPEVWQELRSALTRVEQSYRDLVEIEFTIEAGKLWVLQARAAKGSPSASIKIAHDMAIAEDFPLTKSEAVNRVKEFLGCSPKIRIASPDEEVLGSGIAASAGAASGQLVTNSADAAKQAASGVDVILARPETSPADVEGIAVSAGLVTSRGGLASHAAVVARGWGKPAVVGWQEMSVDADGITIGDRKIWPGDKVTVDGSTGEVLLGEADLEDANVPEALVMQEWLNDRSSCAPEHVSAGPRLNDEDLLLVLHLKGFGSLKAMSEIDDQRIDQFERRLTSLGDKIDLENPAFLRLTPSGEQHAVSVMESYRSKIANGAGETALSSFHALNEEFKTIITDWQMRNEDGKLEPNDHSDKDYDLTVLERFGQLHRATLDWLGENTDIGLLSMFQMRFERAFDLALEDHRFLASPRVDSYHNIWFELHEFLIRLAGKTREEAQAF